MEVDLKTFASSLPDRTWKTPKGHIKTGCSESYAKKCITYLRSVFNLALAIPKQARKPNKRYLSFEGVRRLLDQLDAEDHLILHIELVCAPRPNVTFALRTK